MKSRPKTRDAYSFNIFMAQPLSLYTPSPVLENGDSSEQNRIQPTSLPLWNLPFFQGGGIDQKVVNTLRKKEWRISA